MSVTHIFVAASLGLLAFGACALTFAPQPGANDTDVPLAEARDTRRGWRMSGRFEMRHVAPLAEKNNGR